MIFFNNSNPPLSTLHFVIQNLVGYVLLGCILLIRQDIGNAFISILQFWFNNLFHFIESTLSVKEQFNNINYTQLFINIFIYVIVYPTYSFFSLLFYTIRLFINNNILYTDTLYSFIIDDGLYFKIISLILYIISINETLLLYFQNFYNFIKNYFK
jgi:hypothetical protein